MFLKGPNSRTISLSTHIHILFANKRDEVQVSVLGHQLLHSKMKKINFFPCTMNIRNNIMHI